MTTVFLERLLSFFERYEILSETLFFGTLRCNACICGLSKTFECVDHHLLLIDFQNIRVSGNGLNWIKSFLSGLTQYKEVRSSVKGNLRHVSWQQTIFTRGIPHGSVLGPVSFIPYIIHVDHTILFAFCSNYADNRSLIISGETLEENNRILLSNTLRFKTLVPQNFIAFQQIESCLRYELGFLGWSITMLKTNKQNDKMFWELVEYLKFY